MFFLFSVSFDGAPLSVTEPGVELFEDHSDWVRIRAEGWQEQETRPSAVYYLPDWHVIVAAEVAGVDDVAGGKCPDKEVLGPRL